MDEIRFQTTPRLSRHASVDLDGFEYSEQWKYRPPTYRSVKIVRATMAFTWDFDASKWVSAIKLYGRWVLKDGSLGKEEHEAYSYREESEKFNELRQELIAKYIPTTTVRFVEEPV